jgi:hypothetical protein
MNSAAPIRERYYYRAPISEGLLMQSITNLGYRARGTRVLAVAVLATALASCSGLNGREGEADAKAQAAYARCDQLLVSGTYKTHLAAVDCAIPTVVAAYGESAYPFSDLTYIALQARRIGAAKVDAGDITEAQYQHDLAQLQVRLAAEDRRRHELMKFGSTPQPTPVETLVQGLSAFAPTPTAAELPALPPEANSACLALGDIRRCK